MNLCELCALCGEFRKTLTAEDTDSIENTLSMFGQGSLAETGLGGLVLKANLSRKEFVLPQQNLIQLWEEHTKHEFATRDTESTLATMVEDAYVNHIPVMTGGVGKAALRAFYSRDF